MTLRCPVCRGHLSASDTIDETWLEDEDAWVYRYACHACLSVVSQRIREISHERPRPEPDPPKIDIASAVIARVLETLRAAATDGSLSRVVAELVQDRERRTLLRVPSVFDVSRRAWGRTVRLARAAAYYAGGAGEVVDRTLLVADTSESDGWKNRLGPQHFKRIEEGTALYVKDSMNTTLIVTQEPSRLALELVAKPDFLLPIEEE